MHSLKLNLRLVAITVALAVAVLATSALAPRTTHAGTTDANGVICGIFTGMTLNATPFITGDFGMALTRIDHNLATGDIDLTAVAYLDTAVVGTPNLTWPNCQTAQASPPVGAVPPATADQVRPSVVGSFSANTISGSSCQASFAFGSAVFPGFTDVSTSIAVAPGPDGVIGTFTFAGEYTDPGCSTLAGAPVTFVVSFTGTYHDGPDGTISSFSSDWDKDGCTDWQELAAFSQDDPFKDDCKDAGVVGGVAEIVDVTSTPLEAATSSGTSAWLIAGIAAAAIAFVSLGGIAAYARRRSVS